MPKGSQFDDLARAAALRIEEARDAGHQLTFLPDEPEPGAVAARAPRGKGKITSQLRDWCAARGFRMPEDVLIDMACMASTEDVFLTVMARTEQLLAWGEDGATAYKGAPAKASLGQRLEAFKFVYTAALRAAEAMLPYVAPKVTPDLAPPVLVPVMVAAPRGEGPARPGDQARDVTPKPGRIGPPPMPARVQGNQGVSEGAAVQSDGASRTEGTSR